eukprot:TRINITY_DN3116_c0_g1_i1.p1 TRINITY_DN3116_c0_g1~~TRINITY_DN3116_c0_g1_i1.p1  ORF type:complete len:318 (-),score=78.41 TRINITY_DN3116_c0_g1_i1:354-1190(-)
MLRSLVGSEMCIRDRSTGLPLKETCDCCESSALEAKLMGDSELPPGWEQRVDQGTNRTYFIDHVNGKTTWADPREDKRLPPNWEQRKDKRSGKIYFVHHLTKSTTWNDPRLGQHGNDAVNCARNQLQQPPVADAPGDLPSGWESKWDQKAGKRFYIHHKTKTTQWEPPCRPERPGPPPAALSQCHDPVSQCHDAVPMDGVPNEFVCPITLEIMEDPVMAGDGHTYEREAIENWFLTASTLSSPKTNQVMLSSQVIPNHALKSLILEYRESQQSQLQKK